MARPEGLEPSTLGLAYPLLLSQPGADIPAPVCGLDYLFTVSGAARIVSTDPCKGIEPLRTPLPSSLSPEIQEWIQTMSKEPSRFPGLPQVSTGLPSA